MNPRYVYSVLTALAALPFTTAAHAADIGTAFTFQGNLESPPGTPVTGMDCDFQFGLWDALAGPNQIGLTQTVLAVPVNKGVFLVGPPDIDFGGGAFNGTARWLEIAVRCPTGVGSYDLLSPRVELTPVPYALALPGLYTQQNATSPNIIGGHPANSVTAGIAGATIAGGGVNIFPNVVSALNGTVGGGAGNEASGVRSTVGGGLFNRPTGEFSTVGGGASNNPNMRGSTVGGGENNDPSGQWSTVSGGFNNDPTGQYSTVGGGQSNTASGSNSTVGGGQYNDPTGDNATVGGGVDNNPGGYASTVGGGSSNGGDGAYSTVPGGLANSAAGDYSFCAGRRAQVRIGDEGTFVWADSDGGSVFGAVFTSTGPDQFLIRAAGGTYIYSNAALTAGVTLAAGGGSWSSVSDRNLKENVAEVDTRAVLDRLAQTHITTWNYKSQDDSIRHMGPMGQDFHAAFGIGEKETRITTIDADGVALAAIQGLYQIVQEKDCEVEELRDRNNELEARLARLEALWETREHLNVASPVVGGAESLDGTQKGEKP